MTTSDNDASNVDIVYYDSEAMMHWGGNEYYSIENQHNSEGERVIYIGGFPLEWALSHESETGPVECENCAYHGTTNGVFVGYCVNCAQYTYHGQRGLGFEGRGVETPGGQGESVFSTYLSPISSNMLTLISRMDVVFTNDQDSPNVVLVTEDNEDYDYDYEYQGNQGPDYEGGYNDF
jgi:hypothetical protein